MRHAAFAIGLLALSACAAPESTPAKGAGTPAVPAPVPAAADAVSALDRAVAGAWRSPEARARDAWRHPAETLAFFGVEADDTVVELWPGGGWYTQILGPYLKDGGGRLIAAGFDPEGSEYRAKAVKDFADTYLAQPGTYGDITVSVLSATSPGVAEPGTVDVVLTFRNIHNWMAGGWAEKAFADAYAALKPGGVLGVVEHRLPSVTAQDPAAKSGYVHEDYVIALATEAGFVLEARSDINANAKDTADHPFGVWTLPPVSRTKDSDGNTPEGFDPQIYAAIGESDRMTLKFRKPETAPDAPAQP